MTDNRTTSSLLRELRDEVRDWQDALGGERPGLDALCARIDAHLEPDSGSPAGAARRSFDEDHSVGARRIGRERRSISHSYGGEGRNYVD